MLTRKRQKFLDDQAQCDDNIDDDETAAEEDIDEYENDSFIDNDNDDNHITSGRRLLRPGSIIYSDDDDDDRGKVTVQLYRPSSILIFCHFHTFIILKIYLILTMLKVELLYLHLSKKRMTIVMVKTRMKTLQQCLI